MLDLGDLGVELLGAAQAMTGDRKGALATFTALQTWRPDAVPDPDLGPKQTLPIWEEAHDQVREAERGAIDIESAPEGAMAYVDGLLAAASSTHKMSADEFDGALAEGAAMAGCELAIIERRGLPVDFPVHPAFHEGNYLKFAIAVRSGS